MMRIKDNSSQISIRRSIGTEFADS